jgi:hypothetical protein
LEEGTGTVTVGIVEKWNDGRMEKNSCGLQVMKNIVGSKK